jgi:uncharacterized protein DUF3300
MDIVDCLRFIGLEALTRVDDITQAILPCLHQIAYKTLGLWDQSPICRSTKFIGYLRALIKKKQKVMKSRSRKLFHGVIAMVVLTLSSIASAQQAQSQEMTTTTSDQETATLAPGELDSLVAPIALYSDPLLAQTLAASTYPLEIIQLQQWMAKNPNLKDKALADAVAKQPWDPSVQGLVPYPDVITRMADNLQWTTDLGNAFLAQQSDVMDAVQRMRAKAEGTGNLKTSAEQVVETKTVEGGKQVIVVEQANPEVVYVPSYDPTVVYGPAEADYPYYPYTYPGYVPGTALAWGAGIALGAAAWGAWGGNWGNCDWNGGDVNINNNNNFNKNVNRNVNRGQAGQGNKWQHNAQHRGNAPYGNRQTANKYGGTARGQGGRGAGAGAATRPSAGGAGTRPGGGAGTRPGGGGAGARPSGGGAGAKPGGAGAGARPGGGGAGARPGGGGAGARPGGGSAKNQIGNHSASSRPSAGAKGGGFSGGSGNHARASSSRGGQSMGGGGMSRGGGGGGRGGGGGGGRRR